VAAAAAGVLALGGFGVTVLADMFSGRADETAATSGGPAVAQRGADALGGREPAAQPEAADSGPPRFTTSGMNYWPTDIASESFLSAPPAGGMAPGPSPSFSTGRKDVDEAQVPPPLRGLAADPGAMDACLRQVAAGYGGRPSVVDLARFQNEPALIIVLVDPAGRPVRVVVSGPACGQPGSGADVRFTTPVS
jgi:hypothetical protein